MKKKRKIFSLITLSTLITFGLFGSSLNQSNKNILDTLDLPRVDSITIEEYALGYDFAGVVINDGEKDRLYTAGKNSNGQLGIGNIGNQNTPQEVTELPSGSNVQIEDIDFGQFHGGAILNVDGEDELWTWGRNNEGQLGLGDYTVRNTPQEVTELPIGMTIKEIDFNFNRSGVIVNVEGEDQLYVWGINSTSSLGLGDNTNRNEPTRNSNNLPANAELSGLDFGSNGGAVIANNNQLFMWGNGTNGQLGTGNTQNQIYPLDTTFNYPSGVTFNQVACGLLGTLISVENNGVDELYATGYNGNGDLGFAPTSTVIPLQITTGIPVGEDILEIEKAGLHSGIIIDNNGVNELYMTGKNNQGQLGLGDNADRSTFTEVSALPDGDYYSLDCWDTTSGIVIQNEGDYEVYMWGYNRDGMFGIGSGMGNSNTPLKTLNNNIILPEAEGNILEVTDTTATIEYEVTDWGQKDETPTPWESTDFIGSTLKLKTQSIDPINYTISDPVNGIGTITITNLIPNTLYDVNSLNVEWGGYYSAEYSIPDFTTTGDNPLPGPDNHTWGVWQWSVFGIFSAIGILVLIGIIIYLIILLI